MQNDLTAISEIYKHLSDGEWHSMFSIHNSYRLTPSQILSGTLFLLDNGVIKKKGRNISLVENLALDKVFFMRHILLKRRFSIEEINDNRFLDETEHRINTPHRPCFRLMDRCLKNIN